MPTAGAALSTAVRPIAARASRLAAVASAAGAMVAGWLVAPAVASAHGGQVPAEPTIATFFTDWHLDPLVAAGLLAAAGTWLFMVRRVNAAHPATRVPPARTAAFLGGLAVITVALMSGIEAYDTTLFSVHMVQHVLLILVAAPLLVLAAPITLLLRFSRPTTRRNVILPVLRSRPVRFIGHPVVTWLVFAAVMWGSHFSPLFDAALEDPFAHQVEHALFLAAALLFWWPVVGLDPTPHRMGHPARLLYVFLQMPQNTFLGLVIFFAAAPLYAHYATTGRAWGPSPLEDQQLAGGIMWAAGDIAFLIAILAVVAAWMRHEERVTLAREAREDAARARVGVEAAGVGERRAPEHGTSLPS